MKDKKNYVIPTATEEEAKLGLDILAGSSGGTTPTPVIPSDDNNITIDDNPWSGAWD